MKIRRRGRIAVLQALFEADTVNHPPLVALRARMADMNMTADGAAFCESLLAGILRERAALDGLIHRMAPEWPIEQMAAVDRNILRMAAYEILYADETPPKVAVNEAVELAKVFGSDSSSRFVNGVLGTLLSEYPLAKRSRATSAASAAAPADRQDAPASTPEAAWHDPGTPVSERRP